MKIYLMRHFKVDFKWKKMYNSSEFNHACCLYDKNPIINKFNENVNKDEILNLSFKDLYISNLSRTVETVNSIGFIKTPIITSLLNEVPLRSFIDVSFKIPTVLFFIIGRIQWFFNMNRQIEGKNKTNQRIEKIIKSIELKNVDCLIVGHGFYFYQMEKVLKSKII